MRYYNDIVKKMPFMSFFYDKTKKAASF